MGILKELPYHRIHCILGRLWSLQELKDYTSVWLYGKATEFSKVLPDGLTAFALSKLSSKNPVNSMAADLEAFFWKGQNIQ